MMHPIENEDLVDYRMPALLQLKLPMPLSINHYYEQAQRRARKGNVYMAKMLSEDATNYRHQVYYAVRQSKLYTPLQGRLAIDVLAQPRDAQSFDLDNRWKCLLDSLTYARAIVDDKQFDHCGITRGPQLPGGCVWIRITRFDPARALKAWQDVLPADDLFASRAVAA